MYNRNKLANFLPLLLIIALLGIGGTSLAAARRIPAPGTSPSGQAMPRGDILGWHQTFADDFTGTMLNSSNWSPYYGQPGAIQSGGLHHHM
jgi:hypothetical protein